MKNIICMLVSIALFPFTSLAAGFFEERYRGWLWFEDTTKVRKEENAQNSNSITPKAAKIEIEQLKSELDDLRFVMMARPTPENVKLYREKEALMWQKALELHDAWSMANLLYPEQQDLINNPINVHAVKMKREEDRKNNEEQIRQLAKGFDLVLFFQSNCKYCQVFSPVLKAFGDKYGFNIEAISMDHSKHELFKTANLPDLVTSLGITAAPTVIAISHDSSIAFELIRGYVTLSELEDYSLTAIEYLKNKKN